MFCTALHVSLILALLLPGLLLSTDLGATPALVAPAANALLVAYMVALAILEHVLYGQHEGTDRHVPSPSHTTRIANDTPRGTSMKTDCGTHPYRRSCHCDSPSGRRLELRVGGA
jgi:hypothetical protein